MEICLYSVNPGGRTWEQWLDLAATDNPPGSDVTDLGNSQYYQGEMRFLCLIHRSTSWTQVDQDAYEVAWKSLPESCRDRVWWLFYSGSGYPSAQSKVSNIHYLRYEIKDTLGVVERECFQALLRGLRTDAEVEPRKLWQMLYPPDNVAASTLLALLFAADLDIPGAVDGFMNSHDDLRRAYMEYCGSIRQNQHQHALREYRAWESDLQGPDRSRVRAELQAVLSDVPD
ncbi:MAG TPA: hypothetical protein VGG72_17150 [Bryobacteraceae bacterium]|jgi:hypothetical protein